MRAAEPALSELGPTALRALAGGGAEAVVGLARASRGPLVEATCDPETYDVTFVFADRSGRAERAGVFCPAVPDGFAMLRRLGERVFAGTHRLPRGARVKYHYCPDPPLALDARTISRLEHDPAARRIDYLNPAIDLVSIPELRLRVFESLLTLPGALTTPWLESRARVEAGTVEAAAIHSEILGGDRDVSIYLPPPSGDRGGRLPLVLLLDGRHEWWRAPALFDNLLTDGAARPFVAALAGSGRFATRLRELAGSPEHARFVTDELLPWLSARWPVAAEGHVVAGFSAGALAAAHLALLHPDRFPNLVAISGAFHLTTRTSQLRPAAAGPAWLIEEYVHAQRLPRRVYLAAGSFETDGIHAQSRALAGILRRRGVDVRFDTGPTGHDTTTARLHLGLGLAWIFAGLVHTRAP